MDLNTHAHPRIQDDARICADATPVPIAHVRTALPQLWV